MLRACYARSSPIRLLGSRSRARRNQILNEKVKVLSRVRLIQACGRDGGEMSGSSAYEAAQTAGLDVLQVATGNVPVVRLMDYETYIRPTVKKKTSEKHKEVENPRPKQLRLKQVRLSPATGKQERAMKLRQARGFLLAGHTVRVFMLFKRGHGRLRQEAVDALVDIADTLVPSVATFQGSRETSHVRALFAQEEDPQNPNVPRQRKPLELFFNPLPRQVREHILEKEKNADVNDR